MNKGISIITPTLNSEKTLEKYFEALCKQKYPHHKMEILILDGGSDDKTINIAKKYSKKLPVKIFKSKLKNNQEARRLLGFKKAKFDIVCILDSDNYLVGNDWLQRMEYPFRQQSDLVGSFTLHYNYVSSESLYNRYVALFGVNDTVVSYLKKNDRQKWTVKKWPHTEQVVKKYRDYTLLRFNETNYPTTGGNGFLIRKDFIDTNKYTPEDFFHIDILYDLLAQNKDEYAVVDAAVTHATGYNITHLIRKRIEYMSLHHIKLKDRRRYKVFDASKKSDIFNMLKFIFFTVTFIQPISEAARGYAKVKDRAWFLHPFACWIFMGGYSYAVARSLVKR